MTKSVMASRIMCSVEVKGATIFSMVCKMVLVCFAVNAAVV